MGLLSNLLHRTKSPWRESMPEKERRQRTEERDQGIESFHRRLLFSSDSNEVKAPPPTL